MKNFPLWGSGHLGHLRQYAAAYAQKILGYLLGYLPQKIAIFFEKAPKQKILYEFFTKSPRAPWGWIGSGSGEKFLKLWKKQSALPQA